MTPARAELPDKPQFCREQVDQVILTAEQIARRVEELAAEITHDYAEAQLSMLSVLKGACVFASDLFRRLDLPCSLDFVDLCSYGDETVSSGEVKLACPLPPLPGKRVLVVEDIVDTGRTLSRLVNQLRAEAEEVRVCCLLDKPARREVPVELDYVGFEIPDYFVVGYGLDFAQQYRNLPYVAVLKPEVYTSKGQ